MLGCCRSSFTPNAENIVLGLVGINAGVFMLWRVMKPSFMMDNFTVCFLCFPSNKSSVNEI